MGGIGGKKGERFVGKWGRREKVLFLPKQKRGGRYDSMRIRCVGGGGERKGGGGRREEEQEGERLSPNPGKGGREKRGKRKKGKKKKEAENLPKSA